MVAGLDKMKFTMFGGLGKMFYIINRVSSKTKCYEKENFKKTLAHKTEDRCA